MSVCPVCGIQNVEESNFCFKCGASIRENIETGVATGCLVPDTILEDRYIIIKTLGRGGMGAVYHALDNRLNNISVAIKEMSTNAVHGNLQAAIAAFKKEATMLISLSHTSLPRITDFFSRSEDRWYLVMDYIHGENLNEVVNRRGPIPEATVIEWAVQICEILDFLHNQNPPIIFRDLKPTNIMLTPEGKIKLIDFGIARHFRPGHTADTTAYGSHGFASPEQYGQHQTDARSDVYSLGAVLHFLLTGLDPSTNPFAFDSPSKLSDVSPLMDVAIMKALEIKPSNRPGSVKEMLLLLKSTGPLANTDQLKKQGLSVAESPKIDNEGIEASTPVTTWLEEDKRQSGEQIEELPVEKVQKAAQTEKMIYQGKGHTETMPVPSRDEKTSAKLKEGTRTSTKGNKSSVVVDTVKTSINKKRKTKTYIAAFAAIILIVAIGMIVKDFYKVVNFNDPKLEAGIREKLNKPKGDVLASDMAKLTELFLSSDQGIANLNGLEYAKNLRMLFLSSRGIEDISPIKNLKNLENLELTGTAIKDISPLKNLTNLKYLSLVSNEITDISPLQYLSNLTQFELHETGIKDISPLKNLTNLRELSLRGNKTANISPLINLTNLTYLDLEGNVIKDKDFILMLLENLSNLEYLYLNEIGIVDISPLENLTKLHSLNLSNNGIKDISPLKNLKNLKILDVSGNGIVDISPLKNLTQLNSLNLSRNGVKDISPLEYLTNLYFLSLGGNEIRDITPLKNLKKLTDLRLYETGIKDISFLNNLTNLKGLSLKGNEIKDISPLKNLTNLAEDPFN